MKRLIILLMLGNCMFIDYFELLNLYAQKAMDMKSVESKKIVQYAEAFLKEYINTQYIFSEASEMKNIERKFFDEKTTIGPGGDVDTGFLIDVIENFRITEVVNLKSYYEIVVQFIVKKECRFIDKTKISCKSVNVKKDVALGVRKKGSEYVIDFVYSDALIKGQLLDTYAKRMKYQIVQ
ncbi:hypothetical protein I4Q48_19255 [Leptospira interrogans]|nr:hypothetical protein [Leptospira interrogans]